MTTAPSSTAEKPPKLRWYQYRLRSLFVLTALVAVGMSWLTVTMQNQRKQKAAAEAIEKAGGEVESETTWLGKLLRDDSLVTVTQVNCSGRPHLGGGRLDYGPIPGLVATETVLPHLQGLSQLQYLDLSGTNVADAGLVHLEGLSQLQALHLTGTKVTDEGVRKLQQALPNCKIVR
jgi:hypothetical protein